MMIRVLVPVLLGAVVVTPARSWAAGSEFDFPDEKPSESRVVFKGKTPYIDGQAAGPVKFFTHVGRHDIVDDYESSRTLRTTMMWTGGGIAVLGAPLLFYASYIWFAAAAVTSTGGNRPGWEWAVPPAIAMGGSIVLGLAGAITAVSFYLSDPLPVTPYEYAKESQPPGEDASARLFKPSQESLHWAIAPAVDSRGGGLSLTLRF